MSLDNALDAAGLEWAAKQLGVPADSAPEKVLAEFFNKLRAAEFAPPGELRQAFALLRRDRSHDPLNPGMSSRAKYLQRQLLDSAIESFARGFWNKAPGDRVRLWQELVTASAAFPRLSARLEELTPALHVKSAGGQGGDTETAALLEFLQDLTIRRPHAQAVLIYQFLEGKQGVPRWQQAGSQVRANFPQMAALQPKLLSLLATPRHSKNEKPKNQLKLTAASRSQAANRGAGVPVILGMLVFSLLRAVLSPGCQPSPSTRYADPVRTNQNRNLTEEINKLRDPREPKGSQTSPKLSSKDINESLKRFLEQERQKSNATGHGSQELP